MNRSPTQAAEAPSATKAQRARRTARDGGKRSANEGAAVTRALRRDTIGGEKRTGRRAEFSKGFVHMAAELYPFRAGDAGYVLVFSQTWHALQKPGPPAARRVVEETLTIAK